MAFQSKDSSSEGHKREQQSVAPPRQHGLQPRQMGRTMGRSMNRWSNPLPSVDFSETTQTKVSDPGYPEHTISTKGKIEDARPVTVTIPEESLLSEVQELPPERVIPELQESVGRGAVNRKEDVEIVQYYLLELGLLAETDTLPQEAGTLLEEAQIPHLIAALFTFQEEVLHWQNTDANIGGPASKTLEALKTTTAEQAKAQIEKYPAIKAKREADAAAKAKADAEAQKKREQERAKLKASQAAKKKEQERIAKLKNEASDQNSVENKLKGLESNKEIAAFLIDYVYHNPAFVIQAIKNNSGWIANENTDDLSFAILTKIGKSKLGSIDKELLQYFRATLDSGWTGDEELEWMQAIDRVLSGSSKVGIENILLESREFYCDSEEEDHSEIGKLSEKYETGGRGAGTVSTGKGDRGGVSYGLYQMSSKLKVVDDFIKNEGKQWAKEFSSYGSGSKEFSAAWRKIAIDSNDSFSKAQHQYIYRTHYKVMANKIEKMGLDLSNRSNALKDVIWSTAVQHGPFNSIFQKALKNQDLEKIDDEQIIKLVYGERNRKNEEGNLVYFKSNSADVQKGVSKRFINESKEALEKLNDEKD